jgi:hypothetical protein
MKRKTAFGSKAKGIHMNRNRHFSIFVMLAVGLVFLLASNRCTFKKPVTPSWDLHVEVPLVDTTFTMSKLDEKTKELSIDPATGNLTLAIDEDFKSIEIGKYLKANTAWHDTSIIGIGTIGDTTSISGQVILDNTILIEEAVFDSGTIHIHLNNQTGYTMRLRGETPSLTKNGFPLSIDIDYLPPGPADRTIQLDGVVFKPVNPNSNLVSYQGELEILEGNQGPSNSVGVHVELSNIRYRSVKGRLNRTEVNINERVETDLKISEEFQGIKVGSALMQLSFFIKNVPFPAEPNVWITGSNKNDSDSVYVNSMESFDMAPVLNTLPTTVGIHGKAFIGDGQTLITVSKYDSIRTHIRLSTPLIFSLPARANISDVDTIKIDEDARDNIDKLQKDSLHATLVFSIDNAVPLGGEVSFYFSKSISDTILYHYPDLTETMTLDSAMTGKDPSDPRFRIAIASSSKENTISLQNKDLKIFKSPLVFWQWQIRFFGTSGMVKVRPQDWIRVRCRIEADGRTDFEDWDEKKGGGS